MMDTKFVKDVQMAGWSIQAVSEDAVIGKCPSAGCNLHEIIGPTNSLHKQNNEFGLGILDEKGKIVNQV